MNAESRKRKFLIAISFSAFVLSILSFFAYLIISYNISVAWDQMNAASKANGRGMFFGLYCRADYTPLFLFFLILVTGFIFFLIRKEKLSKIAFFLIDATFFYLLYHLYNLAEAIFYDREAFGVVGYKILFQEAIRFDLAVFLFISILFFCQIGYHFRKLINNLQKKNRLP